jgi:outer membrane lipoprotein carrier protein
MGWDIRTRVGARRGLSARVLCAFLVWAAIAIQAVQIQAQGTTSAGAAKSQAPAKAAAASESEAKSKPAEDAQAQATLASVQAFYDQTKDLSADFVQTYVNKLYDRTDRSTGHVAFKKPGRMRWDYAKPNGKVIVANTGKLLLYEPGDEPSDKGQVFEQKLDEADLPQAMSFLLGTGKLVEDFDAKLLDASHEGFANGQVLELKAKRPSPHFDRLLFFVETQAQVRGLVRRIVIIDPSGNRNRFDFSAFKFNTGTPENTFEWRPPSDARRVHL